MDYILPLLLQIVRKSPDLQFLQNARFLSDGAKVAIVDLNPEVTPYFEFASLVANSENFSERSKED